MVGAAGTAIGTFGGALKDVPLGERATIALREALTRSRVDPAEVGHVVMGNVIPTEPNDAYLARVAAINAGLSNAAPPLMSIVYTGPDCKPSFLQPKY